jgi:hypothetical protein
MMTDKTRNGLILDGAGNKFYYKDGLHHREDGPAIEYTDGYKIWCINGNTTREDGPAVINQYGQEFWYLNNICINVKSQKEFEQYKKLIAFI